MYRCSQFDETFWGSEMVEPPTEVLPCEVGGSCSVSIGRSRFWMDGVAHAPTARPVRPSGARWYENVCVGAWCVGPWLAVRRCAKRAPPTHIPSPPAPQLRREGIHRGVGAWFTLMG